MAKFDHTRHKMLWNWLADNPVSETLANGDIIFSSKLDAFIALGWGKEIDNIELQCFACEYVTNISAESASHAGCEQCP